MLLSTAGRRLGEVIAGQLRDDPANEPILEEALRALGRLQAGRRVAAADLSPALMPLLRPAVQGFLISGMALDPADLIARVCLPILIVQGGRDLQITVADAERLRAARPDARLVLRPEANHVLKRVASSDRAANLAAYRDPALPLDRGVAEAITRFILAECPR